MAVTDTDEFKRIRNHRLLKPWAIGERSEYVRLTPSLVSGRKVLRWPR